MKRQVYGEPFVAEETQETGDWLAVYYVDDGPFVYGPFETEEAALGHILDHYEREYDYTREKAQQRYERSSDEWVTRLHAPEEW
jgi:hypothetical protein